MRRRSLGRGLSELLSSEALAESKAVIEIPVERLSPNPRQPRAELDSDSLEELTVSVEAQGILQPIIVRPVGESYEIVAGERRWRAAQRAGLATVPCLVREVTEEQSLELALVENLQRDDLNAIEAARGYKQLMDEFGLTQERLSAMVGKSRSAVANTLRLLELPKELQEAIRRGDMTEGHGRALLGMADNEEAMIGLARKVMEQGLSVRDTERLVREVAEPVSAPQGAARVHRSPALDPELRDVQERIQTALATRVVLRPGPGGAGRIEVHYSSPEEFERLSELLCSLG